MNAIELLKSNHRTILAQIDELAHDIKQIEQTEQDTVDCDRMNMFGEFRDALTQHTKLEEQILYPELAGFPEIRLLVDESYQEHKRIREVLAKMESLRKEQHCDRWDDTLKELQQNLKRHVAREEDELFPKAVRLLGEVRVESLCLKMEQKAAGHLGATV
jgi:iron-sulfur cluster repair protein YtfE (RIC family)